MRIIEVAIQNAQTLESRTTEPRKEDKRIQQEPHGIKTRSGKIGKQLAKFARI